MQSSICQLHQKYNNVVDLDLSQIICERCALFTPLHLNHHFIEADQLEQHTQSLYQHFVDEFKELRIVYTEDAPQWEVIGEVTSKALE